MVKNVCGNAYGVLDEFLVKLVQSLRKGWDGVAFKNIPVNKRGKKK